MFDSLVDKQLFWVLCPSVFARAAAGGGGGGGGGGGPDVQALSVCQSVCRRYLSRLLQRLLKKVGVDKG